MKRYGLLLLTIILFVSAFGWHYFSVEATHNQKPTFSYVTSRGNKEYVEKLKLVGSIYQPDNEYNQTNFIQKGEETLYEEDFPFLYQMDTVFYAHPSFQRLYENYPNFVKRKNYGNFLIETPETIVEASVDWEKQQSTSTTIQVEKFNKESEDIKKYTFNLPLDNPAEYSYLESIEVVENKLILFLTHVGENKWEDGMNTTAVELFVYQIDLETEKIVSAEPFLTQFPATEFPAETNVSALNSINGDEDYKQKENNLFLINHENEGETLTSIANYDSKDNRHTILDIKEEWIDSPTQQIYEGETLYLIEKEEAGFTVRVFNIETNKLETTLSVPLTAALMQNFNGEYVERGMRAAATNDLLYLVSTKSIQNGEDVTIVVVDLYTGQTVYEGTLEPDNLTDEWKPLDAEIQLIDIEE
ncbi:hypothetical protein [Lacticigenium naphthae]|uniref:hypothetical protein n=1 Tax=Lacticigenium naphthae TaxID=515351 RepID=UPI0004024B31|nr:hypothetical protein [Lacticigenium naphthae]